MGLAILIGMRQKYYYYYYFLQSSPNDILFLESWLIKTL